MSDDRPENQIPGLRENTTATNERVDNIAVDEMGIPILQEIVTPTAEQKTETKAPAKTSSDGLKRALTVPNNEILAKALRNQLRSKVKKDLDDITKDVAAKAVSSITQELEQAIRNQLTEILNQNLEEMIEKTITEVTKVK
jgi:signal recognition particle GTPase